MGYLSQYIALFVRNLLVVVGRIHGRRTMSTITRLAARLLADPTDHPYECALCGRGYDAPRANCPACGCLHVDPTR